MQSVLRFNDEQMNRECIAIRQRLLALANHQNEMNKQQIINLAEHIIEDMMTLLELMERSNG